MLLKRPQNSSRVLLQAGQNTSFTAWSDWIETSALQLLQYHTVAHSRGATLQLPPMSTFNTASSPSRPSEPTRDPNSQKLSIVTVRRALDVSLL
jgi:hypothetical protein